MATKVSQFSNGSLRSATTVLKNSGHPDFKNKAIDELATDPFRYATVMGAFFPDMIREAIKDSMAEVGMTEDDVRELVRKLESPARDQ
jgi:hypothetical protein